MGFAFERKAQVTSKIEDIATKEDWKEAAQDMDTRLAEELGIAHLVRENARLKRIFEELAQLEDENVHLILEELKNQERE